MSKAQNPIEAFGKAAKVYQEKFMDVSAYHNSINFFVDQLKLNSNILELACGPGNLTSYLSNSNKNLNILATDASAEMVELAKQNNPTVNFQILDIKNLSELRSQFDGIVAGFILNYLTKQEVINFLSAAKKMPLKNGLIYISFMEAEEINSGIKSSSTGEYHLYINYFSKQNIETILTDLNFEIIYSEEIPSQSLPSKNDLVLIANQKDLTFQ